VLERDRLLSRIAVDIHELSSDRIIRVAIDGVDGAGKTIFANEVAAKLQQLGRNVIRASVDGFHNPQAIRYQRGPTSPEGFFRDSYDYAALKTLLLDPLSPGGSGRYRSAAFDHFMDQAVSSNEAQAFPGSILIFDGIFLHRPELRTYWDFSIFLDVRFDVSIPRGARRGIGFGSADPESPQNMRYIEGQKLYLSECRPQESATLVVDNNNLTTPRIIKNRESI
jgi:uridine kinase